MGKANKEPKAVTAKEIEAYKWLFISDFSVAETASIMRISEQRVRQLIDSLKKKRPEIFQKKQVPVKFIRYCKEMDYKITTKF